jgi:beta-lactamase class D
LTLLTRLSGLMAPAFLTLLTATGAYASGITGTSHNETMTRTFASIFETAGVQGTFVLMDGQSGQVLRHNPERAKERFLPASTYKIPNTLIALDSGVVPQVDFGLKWDPARAPRQNWWPAAWAQDHTLRTALPNSVVWYYQELARRIGPSVMQSYVNRFEYGNRDISGEQDRFWLTGGLRISADEQIGFLERFYFGELGVSERATQITKELLVMEETPEYRLSGKTGWAAFGEEFAGDSGKGRRQIGWLVGYLERDEQVYFYAINVEIKKDADAAARLKITKAILNELGLI